MQRLFATIALLLAASLACQTVQGAGAPSPMAPTAGSNPPTGAPPDQNFTQTVYVAVEGSDEGGAGTAEAPWATITHALDSVGDGSLILVRPGLYTGRVRIRGQFAAGVTVRSEVPYQAQLRADETVLTIYEAQGITIEGFDIAHASAAAEPIVVQIQDLLGGGPGGPEVTSRITLRNNILHDSYNNDLLKINNGAEQILVTDNVFYNQGDSDEHIDINSVRDVVVEDNIFFNAFGASGRAVTGESSSFIVAKDSNGDEDGIIGVTGLTIRRNVFLHYEGSPGQNMVLLGEDGNAYYEAGEVLIENNLFLGDGADIRAPLGTKGVHNVVFRQNTISGDMPGGAFAWRTNTEGENQPNDNIQLYNNLFSDATGTMNNFTTAPVGETAGFGLVNNLYWNGGQPLPGGGEDQVQISADTAAVEGDPRLNPPVNVPLPVWDAAAGVFGGGAADIRAAFRQLVLAYGVPQTDSAALDRADPAQVSGEDILGQPRGGAPDIGAYEVQGTETAVTLPTSAPGPTPAEGATPAGGDRNAPQPTWPQPTSGGWVTFAQAAEPRAHLYRLALTPNATPEDLTALLDQAAPAQFAETVTVSPDGAWFLLNTDRFEADCVGWPCLVVTQDFVSFEVVRGPEGAAHGERAAIAAGGGLIVYTAGGGPHDRDLWAMRREGSAWSAPQLLSEVSPYGYHQQPQLSADGARVIMACGADPYVTTALCEAQTDGSGLSVRLATEAAGGTTRLAHPSYAPDGSVVFGGEWAGGQLWRLAAGSATPEVISPFTGEASPCVLPDGTIVSVWLQRPGNSTGASELKLMSADGRQYVMLLTGQPIFDLGTGCGANP